MKNNNTIPKNFQTNLHKKKFRFKENSFQTKNLALLQKIFEKDK